MSDKLNFEEITDSNFEILTEKRVSTPGMYRVMLHNDDFTTMDFVVEILISVFQKTAAEATRIMLDVHHQGIGVCGVYILDIARTKVREVHLKARAREFPLRCSYEKV